MGIWASTSVLRVHVFFTMPTFIPRLSKPNHAQPPDISPPPFHSLSLSLSLSPFLSLSLSTSLSLWLLSGPSLCIYLFISLCLSFSLSFSLYILYSKHIMQLELMFANPLNPILPGDSQIFSEVRVLSSSIHTANILFVSFPANALFKSTF